MKHLEFSKGKYLFLSDLKAAEEESNMEFSYKFKDGLKLKGSLGES